MLYWSAVAFIVALIAMLLGFSNIASDMAAVFKIVGLVSLLAFVVLLLVAVPGALNDTRDTPWQQAICRDAARYRYLRSDDALHSHPDQPYAVTGAQGETTPLFGAELDAATDAAMAECHAIGVEK